MPLRHLFSQIQLRDTVTLLAPVNRDVVNPEIRHKINSPFYNKSLKFNLIMSYIVDTSFLQQLPYFETYSTYLSLGMVALKCYTNTQSISITSKSGRGGMACYC